MTAFGPPPRIVAQGPKWFWFHLNGSQFGLSDWQGLFPLQSAVLWRVVAFRTSGVRRRVCRPPPRVSTSAFVCRQCKPSLLQPSQPVADLPKSFRGPYSGHICHAPRRRSGLRIEEGERLESLASMQGDVGQNTKRPSPAFGRVKFPPGSFVFPKPRAFGFQLAILKSRLPHSVC